MRTPIRVLVVEDSEADTALLVRELQRHGYDPAFERVETRDAMSEALDRRGWDVVVADYSMPRFNAPEAIALLREKALDIPFVILSGSIGEETAVAALRAGADDYVMKGNLARLVPAIERELGQSAVRSAKREAEASLRDRVRQQAAVAMLGQRALRMEDVDELLHCTVSTLAETLGVEFTNYMERVPGDEGLLLRAGVGWKPGRVGQAKVAGDTGSHSGYTLRQKGPVIVEDLRSETRFKRSRLLLDHDVVSGMSVIVHGREQVFGVLGAHTSRCRTFTRDDIHFLQSVANLLAAAFERNKSEQALARLAAFPEENPNPIIELDLGYRLTYLNPAATARFPQLRSQGLGHPVLHGIPLVIQELILAGKRGVVRELACDHHQLEQIISLDQASKLVRIYVVDVTDRKRLEEQTFQAQKLEAIEQLAGGIAHHFNNLMAGVMGFSEIMLMKTVTEDPLHRYAEQIKNAADRAATLTRQLLEFSRLQPRHVKPLDLNAVVGGMNATLRSLVRDGVELRLSPSVSLGPVEADPLQIEQLIVNLVVNARDAMPEGGALTIATSEAGFEEETVDGPATISAGRYVVLAVSDTGKGMSEDVKPHVFEPFFTTKEALKGTGMGLATCHGIMKQSGGCITFDSVTGKGTTFRCYFPRVA